MANEKVTIVVAVHNGERTIRECVESLLATDYENKQVVVVNDGSTDHTADILAEFGDRIIVLTKEQGGVSQARNVAIRWSDASYIAMTDADCVVHPGWLYAGLKHFADSRVGAVTGWLRYRITNVVAAVRDAEYFVRFDRRKKKAYSVSCPIVLFRRSALLAAGGFDEYYQVGGEDTDVGYRLSEKGFEIVYEPEMVAYHMPEDKLTLYLKRNYRNAVSHIRVVWQRRKRHSFRDDFFPLTLRLQPVFTLLLLLFFIKYILSGSVVSGIITLAVTITVLFSFLPVVTQVIKTKGVWSLPFSIAVLSLRNMIWLLGLFAGLRYIIRGRL